MIEPRIEAPARESERARGAAASRATYTLAVAASATLLVLAVFAAPVTTVGETARSLHAGVAGQTWTLSAMSLGLATALLPVGAIADELGRRRVLVWSALLLAAANAVAAAA
jgi:MFS family permease